MSKAHNGKSVLVRCESNNILSRARYPFEVVGSFQTGTFQPADYIGDPTNCPDQISYPPKSGGSDSASQDNTPKIDDMDYKDEL